MTTMMPIGIIMPENYLETGIVSAASPGDLGTMKTILQVLTGEMKPTRTTERICGFCVVVSLLCFIALMIATFSNPV